jgi:hypothetical protein
MNEERRGVRGGFVGMNCGNGEGEATSERMLWDLKKECVS